MKSLKSMNIAGEVFAMSGSKTTYNRIVVNTLAAAGQFPKKALWELREYKTIGETLLIQTIQMELPLTTLNEGTKPL